MLPCAEKHLCDKCDGTWLYIWYGWVKWSKGKKWRRGIMCHQGGVLPGPPSHDFAIQLQDVQLADRLYLAVGTFSICSALVLSHIFGSSQSLSRLSDLRHPLLHPAPSPFSFHRCEICTALRILSQPIPVSSPLSSFPGIIPLVHKSPVLLTPSRHLLPKEFNLQRLRDTPGYLFFASVWTH